MRQALHNSSLKNNATTCRVYSSRGPRAPVHAEGRSNSLA
jgi:hypothetical protein